MTTRDALIRAILREPADDVARLVFADYLDEHDEPARAEFVRVQVELARLPKGNPGIRSRLASHEAALWERFHEDWCEPVFLSLGIELVPSKCPSPYRWDNTATLGRTAAGRAHPSGKTADVNVVKFQFTRGFVSQIELPLASFMEHGRGIFAAHPVVSVLFTDRSPFGLSGTSEWVWTFYPDGQCYSEVLPRDFYVPLAAHPLNRGGRDKHPHFLSKEQAILAAGECAVNLGRAMNDLPPLPLSGAKREDARV